MLTRIIRADGTTELSNIKSCTFTEQVNTNGDLRVGCVSSAQIQVTVFGEQTDAPAVGEALTYYQVDENNVATKIGVFYAQPTVTTKNTYSFVAYDAVSKLDIDFSEHLDTIQDDFPMTLMDIVEEAATVAGVTLVSGLTFPMETLLINKFYQKGITCRQVLSWASEIAGRFVRCNEDGEIEFAWYTASSDVIAPSDANGAIYYKQDGLQYENYTTSTLDRVVIYQVNIDVLTYTYPTNVTSGNTYTVSGNMLLMDASDATYTAVAENIYNVITALGTYRPFSVKLFPFNNPFRAGDKITVTDSQGVTFTTIVMNAIVSANNATLSSTGGETFTDTSGSSVAQAYALVESAKDSAYFWFQSEVGSEQGAHITQVPKDAFLQTPQGGNTLINTDGVTIRDAEKEIAKFTPQEVRVGETNRQRLSITTDGVHAYNKDNALFFDVDYDGGDTVQKLVTYNIQYPNSLLLNDITVPKEQTLFELDLDGTSYTTLIFDSDEEEQLGDPDTSLPNEADAIAVFFFADNEIVGINKNEWINARSFEGLFLHGCGIVLENLPHLYEASSQDFSWTATAQVNEKVNDPRWSGELIYLLNFSATYDSENDKIIFKVSATKSPSSTVQNTCVPSTIIQISPKNYLNIEFATRTPAFTFGTRKEGSTIGSFSVAMGDNLEAAYAHQTVIGGNNDNKQDTRFEIGYGGSDDPSSAQNSFEVTRDGNIRTYLDDTGALYPLDGEIYNLLLDLGWEGDVIV